MFLETTFKDIQIELCTENEKIGEKILPNRTMKLSNLIRCYGGKSPLAGVMDERLSLRGKDISRVYSVWNNTC